MAKTLTSLAALSGFLTVALGAFGAHALKQRLSAEMFTVYQTAVHYQMFHTIAILGCALLAMQVPSSVFQTAGYILLGGVVVFCGSLYALALTEVKILGAITPFGGLAFLVGWAVLGWGAIRSL